jgi:hypothetical protein
LRLEHRFVELRVIEGGKGRGATLHGRDETLLARDEVRDVAEPGSLDEVQADFRLAPDFVERIVPQEKAGHGLVHAIASVGQIPRLSRGAKGRSLESDCGGNWLCPEGNYSHR